MPELWHCFVYLSLVRIRMRFPDALRLSSRRVKVEMFQEPWKIYPTAHVSG